MAFLFAVVLISQIATPAYATVVFSPNGARISATAPSPVSEITDASTARWTLVGGVVFRSGVKTASAGVTNLYLINDRVYQENAAGSFWYWNTTISGWAKTTTPWKPSANDTEINATNDTTKLIIDSQTPVPNFYALSAGVVYKNGAALGTSGGVTTLFNYTVNGSELIFQENSAKKFWYWNQTTKVWVSCSDPRIPAPQPTPSPPSAVQALGYTYPTFYDDFSNVSKTVDLDNTLAPGYKWYVACPWNRNVTPKANFSSSKIGEATPLFLSGDGAQIYTATRGVTGAPIGNTFGIRKNGGAFYEASMAIMGLTPAGAYAWPTFYGSGAAHLDGRVQHWVGHPDPSYEQFIELDIMELFPSLGGPRNNISSTIIDWFGQFNTPTTDCEKPYCKSETQQYLGPDTTGAFVSTGSNPVFHRYGALWVPSVVNSSTGKYSTGYVQWYIDGVPTGTRITWVGPPSTTQFNYTPTASNPKETFPWRFSELDNQELNLIAGTFNGQDMYIKYVGVWQLP